MVNNQPQWAADFGLHKCGNYYEGFVDDLEVASSLLNTEWESVTSYGV